MGERKKKRETKSRDGERVGNRETDEKLEKKNKKLAERQMKSIEKKRKKKSGNGNRQKRKKSYCLFPEF